MYFTFTALLVSAVMAGGVQRNTSSRLNEVARANSLTELEDLLKRMRSTSLRHRDHLERLTLPTAFGLGILGLVTFLDQSIPT
jgi:hypothetical protein